MRPCVPFPATRPFSAGVAAASFAAVFWLALGVLPAPVLAQSPPPAAPATQALPPPQQPASAAVPARRPAPARSASASRANGKQSSKSSWRELSPADQQALAPLAGNWDTISDAQKRKWLALSHNFPKMSPAEQSVLHSRMSEWAALSPQQRTQARLNFGATRKLSPDDKKAKWEAYQALSPEEKDKLAAKAAKPPPTAAALKPVPAEKLATVPPKRVDRTPRTAAVPGKVDRNTLLPRPAAVPASGQAR